MFNSSIPPRSFADKAKEAEALSSLGDMLTNLLLEADMPEEQKITVKLCKAAKQTSTAVHALMEKYANPKLPDSPELFETRKQVLEYLGLVELGLKQFMETTKLPNEI